MDNKLGVVLSEYNRLENDVRRYVGKEDEEIREQWLDEAIEAERNVIRCYINQYINLTDLPEYMQEILVEYEYTLGEKQSMVEGLEKVQESLK